MNVPVEIDYKEAVPNAEEGAKVMAFQNETDPMNTVCRQEENRK